MELSDPPIDPDLPPDDDIPTPFADAPLDRPEAELPADYTRELPSIARTGEVPVHTRYQDIPGHQPDAFAGQPGYDDGRRFGPYGPPMTAAQYRTAWPQLPPVQFARHGQPFAPPQRAAYAPYAAGGPQANASVVNNIRVGGGGYYGPRCNHALHATLTVLTCGLWSPVWLLAWLASKGGR